MASLIGDLGSMLGVNSADMVKNSTSRRGNTELNMDDFLRLMIVQLTNQTIDDTMDTSEMMNQMLQMQMITAMANMNDISIQSYANSLVGKDVTVGLVNGNVLEERVTRVMATGTYNGQQVIFCLDGNMYFLSQIMAVGELPDENGHYASQGSGGLDGSVGVNPDLDPGYTVDPEPNPDDPADPENPGDVTQPDETGSGGATENPEYEGENGVSTDTE